MGKEEFHALLWGLGSVPLLLSFLPSAPTPPVWLPPLAPQGTKSASPYSGLRGVVCVIWNRVSWKGLLSLITDESGGGRESQPRSCLPAASEVISSAQVLFSAVNIGRSGSFVFLILLLFLRQTVRPFLTHANLALTCFSNFLRLTPCWA